MRTADLGHVAGIVDGEGSIDLRNGRYPRLQINMTDRDVLKRCQAIVGGLGHVRGPYGRGPNKPMFSWDVSRSASAAGLLLTLYPFLGQRRRQRIREVLAEWRAYKPEVL